MKNAKLILIAILVVLSYGCMNIKMASPELDKAAKEFAPPADKSYIYVMREWAYALATSYMTVVLKEWLENDRIYDRTGGFLKNSTYVLFEVPPGNCEVFIGSNQIKAFPGALKQRLKLVTLPGHTYFIATYFNWGVNIGTTTTELLSKDVGKKSILDYERVAILPLN